MIIITKTFEKYLQKIKSITLIDVFTEIRKHESGLTVFKKIQEINGNIVYKGYLFSNKVRLLVFFEKVGGYYLPFYIVRKETKVGWNINKNNFEEDILGKLNKSFEDLENGKYEIIG